MAGLVPGIHALNTAWKEGVDARHEAGHDRVEGNQPSFFNQRLACARTFFGAVPP